MYRSTLFIVLILVVACSPQRAPLSEGGSVLDLTAPLVDTDPPDTEETDTDGYPEDTAAPEDTDTVPGTKPFCDEIPGAISWWTEDTFESNEVEPTRTYVIPSVQGDLYDRLIVDLDVTFAGWDAGDPSGTHGVFQLTRSETWRSNLYGYMTLFGPNTNKAKVISNIDLAAGEVTRLETTGVTLAVGTTYHVHYTYDPGLGERRMLITAGEEIIVNIADTDVAAEVTSMAPGYQLILGSDNNANGPEVLTRDWVFDNVCVQIVP